MGVSMDAKIEPWKICVDIVNNNLDHMEGHYFVKETFKGNSHQEVMIIIDNILTNYEKDFHILDWLDKPTHDGAIEKLKKLVQSAGYSTETPNLNSSKSLDEYYKNYSVSASDHFSSQAQYSASTAARKYILLPLAFDRKVAKMGHSIPNAYYDQSLNSIYFMVGILRPPFFHVENPEYMNYGAFGGIAGHEIGWWSNTTEKTFNQKAQCFVEQYGNFTIKGPDGKDYNLNGKFTLRENLADNGGLKMSFRAWQSRIKFDPQGKKIKNFKLPGQEKYTPEQHFFMFFGRNYFKKMRPEAVLLMVQADNHSPSMWSINGVAQTRLISQGPSSARLGAP
ncbi:hypothetical protein BGZ95_005975 [Linnemannia exigua]|uniref:Uncharacterized protein n=1 Tax=Linnemannia exigua TaxID=604196 RepID=A0AAD4D1W7_9FUNG|nr:hypothetical protein BGZ95_005975 [Linnemannia exigua]